MSIIWADNFQTYGTDESKLLDGLYAQISGDNNPTQNLIILSADPDPNADAASKCIKFSTAGSSAATNNQFRWVNPNGVVSTLGVAFRIWLDGLPSDTDQTAEFSFRDINNDEILCLEVQTTGALKIIRGGEGDTVLGTSTLPVLTANAWNHVELKVTFNTSSGATEVRVNGTEVGGLTLTSQNTTATALNCAQVSFVGRGDATSAQAEFYIKDFVVWDTNGSQNNDFLGTVHVYTLQVNGDSSFNWTPSSGSTGYNLIDELTPSDSDYIEADDTPPAASSFELEGLPADIIGVKALIPVVRARKTDGGDGQLQMSISSNGFDDAGTDRALTTAYTYYWDVSEVSPDSAGAYTPVEVDSVTFKIDRTV